MQLISRFRRFTAGALATLGLVAVLVTITPVLRWWAYHLATPWEDARGDILIVLGAETNSDVIGQSSYWRSVYAVRTWREGWVKHIVISGGPMASASGQVPAAERMKEFLVSQGVPEELITAETQSASTRENALFSKPIIEKLPGRAVLLTSDYHAYRAMRVFRAAGIAVEPRPIPDALKRYNHWYERATVFQMLALESAKIVVYWWRGWLA